MWTMTNRGPRLNGKMPRYKISLLTAVAVISPPSHVSVTGTRAIILWNSFACLRCRECQHLWTSLIWTCPKCSAGHFSAFFRPTFGGRSLSPPPLVPPQSANQTSENELKSSLVIKRCGCLEQVHESQPKRNLADFKYKHLWSAVEPSNPLLLQAIKRTAVSEMRKWAFGLLFQSHFQWIIGKVVWRLQSWILS